MPFLSKTESKIEDVPFPLTLSCGIHVDKYPIQSRGNTGQHGPTVFAVCLLFLHYFRSTRAYFTNCGSGSHLRPVATPAEHTARVRGARSTWHPSTPLVARPYRQHDACLSRSALWVLLLALSGNVSLNPGTPTRPVCTRFRACCVRSCGRASVRQVRPLAAQIVRGSLRQHVSAPVRVVIALALCALPTSCISRLAFCWRRRAFCCFMGLSSTHSFPQQHFPPVHCNKKSYDMGLERKISQEQDT